MAEFISDNWHRQAANITVRNGVQPRRWGLRVTVFNDPTPANNGDYVLSYNLSSTRTSDNSNWLKVADIGQVWGGGGGGSTAAKNQSFNTTGVESVFQVTNGTIDQINFVEVNGEVQRLTTDYTVTGQFIDFGTALPASCTVVVYYYEGLSIGSGVQSVTGNGVNNSDPLNPVLTFPTASQVSNTPSGPIISTTVQGAINELAANASETVAGRVQEATDGQTQAGTAAGSTGARLFVNPAKLATWWTFVKTQAQTFANLTATTFSAVAAKITGQAAASGKKNGVLILDDGTIQKVAWVEHDTTSRTITEIGVDDLVATILHEWKNSSGNTIMQILNGQQIMIGGTTFVIQVGSTITSGNARIRMNDNQAMCLIFEDTAGKEHISFRSTDLDERFNVSIPERFRPLIATVPDANIDSTVFRFTSGSSVGVTETVGFVSLPFDETTSIVWVKWTAIANDGEVGWGQIMMGVQRTSTATVQGIGTQDAGSGTQRSSGAGNFNMALVADNTNKRVNLAFTNSSSGAKAFKITALILWTIVDEPA